MISTQPCNPFSRRALGSNICHRNCFSLRLSGRKAHSPARALETPTEPIELAQWASSRFEEEADLLKDRPLVERCMLVALEEEASETAFGLSMSRQPPADRDKRSGASKPESILCVLRYHGSTSTWSLKRLDSLAAEAQAAFQSSSGLPPDVRAFLIAADPAPAPEPNGWKHDNMHSIAQSLSQLLEPMTQNSDMNQPQGLSPVDPDDGPQQTCVAQEQPCTGIDEQHSPAAPGLSAVEGQGTAASSQQPLQQQDDPIMTQSGGGPHDAGSGSAMQSAMRQFPAQFINAVNEVLFNRHGYRHVLRPGNPRDAQMHRVLEDGTGCPVALAILYKEVCARLSVHMEIRVMERGQHALLWPKNCKRLQIDGKPLVIDIVNGGTLVLAEKVPGLELPLEASDDCSILEGLLEALRTAYWCQAVGCTPDQPIETTVQAAVEDFVQPMSSSYDLLRSAAAINKMAALMSYDRRVNHITECNGSYECFSADY
ncbi:hypothetical protein WJX73_009776 [Symbiochloris irregularis]|uniref:Protein SirB1 N-terminal domain-containing protein n=1 Tax=Symbiochloris irregularis TaxID=706552 RepID=A0AAW1P0N3_9CHLO